MREVLQAIFLGLTQGLTEFLPLSSSGHLVLIREVMGADFGSSSLFFDVMLHVGTLISLIAVFLKDILTLFRPPFKKIALLLLASLPAALTGLLLNDYFAQLQQLSFVCFAFLFNAVLLFVTQIIANKRDAIWQQRRAADDAALAGQGIRWQTALLMGVSQAVAVLPGVSRSGSTICTGILCGEDRKSVAQFSFYMSAVIIVGSALVSSIKLASSAEGLTVSVWAVVAGTLSAAIAGYCAVKLMLRIIGKANYKWFSLYLLVAFAVSFIDAYIVNLF